MIQWKIDEIFKDLHNVLGIVDDILIFDVIRLGMSKIQC